MNTIQMKRLFFPLVLVIALFFSALGFSACGKDDGNESALETETKLMNAYTLVQANGFTGTYEDFIGAIKGDKGEDGVGISSIEKASTNGNVDTYTITLTNEEQLTFTITNGINGSDGKDGTNGVGISLIAKTSSEGLEDTYTITYTDNTTSTFVVKNGANGADGQDGKDGKDGLNGQDGADGVSVVNANINENGELVLTLSNNQTLNVGVVGANGQSAYEIYKKYFNYQGTESEWISDLINGNLATVNTVTFDSQGGSETPAQSIKYGGKASKPQNPTKAGYEFAGWFYEDEKWVFVGYSITENITLEAKWNAISYNVTFNFNGNGENYTQSLTFEDDLVLPVLDFDGYTYEWQVEGQPITNGKWNIAKNTEIVLIKTPINYNITYNLDGGTNENNPSSYTIESETIILNKASKTGYDFVGWFDNAKFNGNAITQISKGSTGNLTLYAKFTEIVRAKLTYSLNNDNNSYSVTGIEDLCGQTEIIIPETYNDLPVTKIGDYAFSFDGASGNISSIVLGSGVTTIGDGAFDNSGLTKIYYNGSSEDYGKISFGEYVFPEDITVTVFYLTLNKENETQEGNWWYYNNGEITEKVITYCTVTYISGEDGTSVETKVLKGSKITNPEDAEEIDTLTFVCWCTDEELQTQFNFETPIENNLTLYAKYVLN